MKSYKLVEYKNVPGGNWEYVRDHRNEIFNFMNESYNYAGLGNFEGCDNARAIWKNPILIRIAFVDEEYAAISIYTDYRGGYKCVGIGASINQKYRPVGKEAVKDIIKKDIGLVGEFFWCECSGAIEHLYEKNGGIKIPSVYLPCFFDSVDSIELTNEDEYHFNRKMRNGEFVKKVIYGFNDISTVNTILKSKDKKMIDVINKICFKVNEDEIFDDDMMISKRIIDYVYELKYDDGYSEFPKDVYDALERSVEYIESRISDGSCPENLLNKMTHTADYGREILDSSTIIEFHKL